MSKWTIHRGDVLDHLKQMTSNSFDAMLTDPPAGLTSGKLRTGAKHCLYWILLQVHLPNLSNGNSKPREEVDFTLVLDEASVLHAVDRSAGINAWIAVPVGPVNLDSDPKIVDPEIDHGSESASGVAEHALPLEGGADITQYECDLSLNFRAGERAHTPCEMACGCYRKLGPGLVALPVVVGSDSFGSSFLSPNQPRGPTTIADDVGLGDKPGHEPIAPSGVVTRAATELVAILTLDMAGRTAKLSPALGAYTVDSVRLRLSPRNVRAGSGTSSLSSELEPTETGRVRDAANGTDSRNIVIHVDKRALSEIGDSLSEKGFMGKSWDATGTWLSIEVWQEALRVLKPGAYALVWSIPRTSHHTGMVLEKAGFRIRDTVLHCFGSGFPKSLSLSRAIDDHNGDVRPIHGTEIRKNSPSGIVSAGRESVTVERSLTSAASAAWEAYGSALKPGMEIWWLVQKPLEGTYAENALKWGVGGINVDGCRIGREVDDVSGWSQSGSHASDNVAMSGANYDRAPKPDASGRWPANLCLSHSASCRVVGQSETTRSILGAIEGAPVKSIGFTRGSKAQVKRGEVTEVTEVTECAGDCPIRQMNEQSGDRPGMSGGGVHREDYPGGTFGGIDSGGTARNDNGGSARFFSNFAHDDDIAERFKPFLYCAKPNKSETEFGCEGLPLVEAADLVDREEDSAGMDSPRAGAGRSSAARNTHPTKKGVTLTQWLGTMILPPERSDPRRIIVPFFGSGGEGLGAMRAGFEEIVGIELEPAFAAIAEARMVAWSTVPAHLEPGEVKAEKVDARQISLFGKVGT